MIIKATSALRSNSIVRKQADSCPEATQDLLLNLENRQNAIDNVGYGPLNPSEPNVEFWDDKAQRWNISPEEAKTAVCGNCVFFVRTPRMLDCISSGLGDEPDTESIIDGGVLGYCQALDFKCAAKRTCNAWAVGGPITKLETQNSEQEALSRSVVKESPRLSKESFRVGSFVSWNSSGGRARGKIERVTRDGEINVPDSSFSIEGDEENPAALIRVWNKGADGWEPTDTRVGHKFTALSSIEDLSKQQDDDSDVKPQHSNAHLLLDGL